MGDWPLIGRAAELAQVDTLLSRGTRGIVLAGPPGVGKSRMGDESLRLAASRGFATVRVGCTKSASAVPFGPFASLLPELDAGADRGDVLRQIVRAITAAPGDRGVAVLVDDAHLLDEPSSVLTYQLASNDHTFMVVTLRSEEAAPDAVVALWKDGIAERLELSPLSVDDVDMLLAAVLGGPADGATVRVLWERAQGNVLFLKELVVAALEEEVLRDEGGIWRLQRRTAASARLVELVGARLAGLDEEQRRALSVLVVGEPLGLDVYASIAGAERVATLEERGLVRVQRDGRRLQVRLEHPLYGDVLRSRLSPLRLRSACRTLSESLEVTGVRRRDDVLRLATWRLEGGGEVRPSLMLAAARQARARWDLPLAQRFVRAALDAGAGFDASLLLGQLLWLQGRAEDAEQHLASLVASASTDAERAALAVTRMDNLLIGLGRLDDAVSVAEKAETTIADLRCRDTIAAQRARLLYLSGRLPPALDALEPVLPRAEGNTLVEACITAASALGLAGRSEAALAAVERGLAAHLELADTVPALGPHIHLVTRCLVLTHAGHLGEAERLARHEYSVVASDNALEAQAFFSTFLARTLLLQGKVEASARSAREGAALFRDRGAPFLLRVALMPLALSLALLGRISEAREALAELDALGLPPDYMFGPEIRQAAAWAEIGGGDLKAGHRLLDEAIRMAEASGERVLEVAALHDLARLGEPRRVLRRLQALAEVIEGPLTQARVAHTAALVVGDPVELDAASHDFESLTADLLAAEAAADAAVAFQRRGEPRRAMAQERRAEELASRCEGAVTPALTTSGRARVTLTPRELEIARLAADGVPNRVIADRLYLSVHTVQNKLHAAYEKLGIRGRAELGVALRGHPSADVPSR